jgi:hypothetical protein
VIYAPRAMAKLGNGLFEIYDLNQSR